MHLNRNKLSEETRLIDESLFTCASGKLGVRGNFEEGVNNDLLSIRGTYLIGFCETEYIKYNEKLFGFPEEKQVLVNLPDAQTIEIFLDSNKVSCLNNNVENYNYSLDMENGQVKRSFVYKTDKGNIKISFERLTSFKRQGLFSIRCIIKSIDYAGKLSINSTLNGNVSNYTNELDPRVSSGNAKMLNINIAENITYSIKNEAKIINKIEAETINSHRCVSCNVINAFYLNSILQTFDSTKDDVLLSSSKEFNIKKDDEITLVKYCFYHDTSESIDGIKEVLKAYEIGFDSICEEQKSFLNDFWLNSRIIIESDVVKQEHIDLCLYSLLCSAGRDAKTSVAAKGLSGEGYEGHYFWDCETYIFPVFLLTNPLIAKSLLMYRYLKLDEAKKHARMLSHKKGALFPWRTITGSECSSYYPSGSAQYHINGDVARAFIQYWNCTNDLDFLPYICEVLLETSRLWIDVGHYDDGKFKIDCVTGPDEYTCLVNNNYYTNASASNNLKYTVILINKLKELSCFNDFKKKTGLSEDELLEFKKASDSMYYPFDENLGIIKQDDSFLNKKRIDLNSLPKNSFPLLLNYHPLFLYRTQICKQADAVLADHLYLNLDYLTSKRTFDYYENITTHDSSLSKCIYGIMACKLGDLDKSMEYFLQVLSTDINDKKGNTKDGLHMANMAGCYRMVTSGFAGLKIDESGLSIFPQLPKQISSYSFTICYLNRHIHIYLDQNNLKLSLAKGDKDIEINVYDQTLNLTSKEISICLKPKAVIFDLDGVITNTASYHYEAWKKVADELNVEFNEDLNENFKGVSRSKCLELLLKWGNIKLTDDQFNEILDRKNNYYKDLLNNLSPKDILPGIIEAIHYLKENGIKIALFSVSKNTNMILEKLNIFDLFDTVITGNDISNSKPHFEGYLLAAKNLDVDPKLCVMVEDSISGINGAKSLAMKTIAIMNNNDADADYCINKTEELNDTFKSIFSI